MQMFHTPVTSAMQGDRLGICVTQFDPKLLERGLVCAPESLHTVHAALISVEKIPYFRGPLQTKAKFHITVGHETVMGRMLFFSPAPDDSDREPVLDSFDFSREYLFQEQYLSQDLAPVATDGGGADKETGPAAEGRHPRQQWALVEFEKPVTCPRLCLVIGSRLDADIHASTCRLAFHGVLLRGLEDRDYAVSFLPSLRVYKLKCKQGLVERVRSLPARPLPRGAGRPGGARLGSEGTRRTSGPSFSGSETGKLRPCVARRPGLSEPTVTARGLTPPSRPRPRPWWGRAEALPLLGRFHRGLPQALRPEVGPRPLLPAGPAPCSLRGAEPPSGRVAAPCGSCSPREHRGSLRGGPVYKWPQPLGAGTPEGKRWKGTRR